MPKILVIDDDPQIRTVITLMLERQGHSVVLAENGITGVVKHRVEQPDLVITDMMMPKQGGDQTIRQILAEAPGTRIIAISGGGNPNEPHPLIVARRLGAVEVLHKPFSLFDFGACVARALSVKRPDPAEAASG